MKGAGIHADPAREGDGMRRALERMAAQRAEAAQRDRLRGNARPRGAHG